MILQSCNPRILLSYLPIALAPIAASILAEILRKAGLAPKKKCHTKKRMAS